MSRSNAWLPAFIGDKDEAVHCGNGRRGRDLDIYNSLDSPSIWYVSKSDKLTSIKLEDLEAFTEF